MSETRVEEQLSEQRRIAELEAQLVEAKKTIARLRERYQHALEKLALAERRIIAGNAERRVDTNADQLTFEGAFAELKALEKELADATDAAANLTAPPPVSDPPSKKPDGRKTPSTSPKGRRDLSKASLPLVTFEMGAYPSFHAARGLSTLAA